MESGPAPAAAGEQTKASLTQVCVPWTLPSIYRSTQAPQQPYGSSWLPWWLFRTQLHSKDFQSLYLVVMEIIPGAASPVKGLELLGLNKLQRR